MSLTKVHTRMVDGPTDAADVSYNQGGASAIDTTVEAKLQEFVSVIDYGADPTGVDDSSTAIQAAIDENDKVTIPFGIYRCDSAITITSSYLNQKFVSMDCATLIRTSAGSSSTDPVIELLGGYGVFDGNNGFLVSENNSPRGVAVLGHSNHTSSNYNAIYLQFKNVNIVGNVTVGTAATFNAYDSVGVYVPSSQPNLGSNAVNYFGSVENVHVTGVSTGLYMTDLANGYTLYNFRVRGFSHRGVVLAGAYGNTIYGGFMELCYLASGGIGIYLATKNYPSAPSASSLESMYNNIYGITMELTNVVGLQFDANCSANTIQYAWNSTGTELLDNDGNNTILAKLKTITNELRTDKVTGIGAVAQTVDIAPYGAGYTAGMGMTVSSGQGVYPLADNTTPLGLITKRWSEVFAGTGTINTSDGNLKQDVRDITTAESNVATALKGKIKAFKFTDAVESKGDNARTHFGVIAQDVKAAFEAEGLDATNYGIFCSDTWTDEDGNEQTRLGIRYDELFAFIISTL